jgi:hypothetical protein
MFRTIDEAARAYDAVMWRFGRSRRELNFPEVESAEEAQFLAPPPLLETREERRNHERIMRRISIAEADERMMAEHRRLHPKDVAREEGFWVHKKQERRAACAEKMRKKAWIEAEYNNSNTKLDDEDLHWLEYNVLTFEDSNHKE